MDLIVPRDYRQQASQSRDRWRWRIINLESVRSRKDASLVNWRRWPCLSFSAENVLRTT